MPFNFTTSVYTPPGGATNAAPGQVIASAIWNTIHADLSTALTQLGTYSWEPKSVSGNYSVAILDNMVQVVGSSPQITLPPSSSKAGPVVIIGSSAGIFNTSPSTVLLTAGDTFNGSSASPCFTLTAPFQAQIFYPLPTGGYIGATGAVNSFNGRAGAVTLLQSDLLPLGGLYFNRVGKTGAYTIVNTDAGSNIALSGGTFYQVAFNAPATYSASFAVLLTNEEALAGGRAKFITGVSYAGRSGVYLWPGQAVLIYNSNNQLIVIGKRRLSISGNPFNFYVNPATGNDTWGSTDGLTAAQPFATIQPTLLNQIIPAEVDFNGIAVQINLQGNNTTQVTAQVTSTLSNSAPIIIDGGGTGILSGQVLALYGGKLRLQNLTLQGTSGLNADRGGYIECLAGITFGVVSQNHMIAVNGGQIMMFNNYTITGGAAFHMNSNANGYINAGVGAVTVSGSIAFSGAVAFCQQANAIAPQSWTGTTPTGQKYLVAYNGVLLNASLIPGTIAGAVSTGGQFT